MDDEDIRLRDKFAIEILGSLINASNSNLISDFIFNMDPAYKNDHPMDNKAAIQHLELSVRAAYKIADIMRKVRLTSFE